MDFFQRNKKQKTNKEAKKKQFQIDVPRPISIHRINSYLAHVKLQTSHVPLNGFDLLQKDRDSTLFYYSLIQHDDIWHKAVNSTIISVGIMRQLVCVILNAIISQLIFTSTAHFSSLSQFILYYSLFINSFITSLLFTLYFSVHQLHQIKYKPKMASNLQQYLQQSLCSVSSPCQDHTGLPGERKQENNDG